MNGEKHEDADAISLVSTKNKRMKLQLKYLNYVLVSLMLFMVLDVGVCQENERIMDEYVEAAERSNPGLQAAYKEYEEAMARIFLFKSLPDPSVSFGVFVNSVETRVGAQRFKFSVSQMFPWFGSLNARGKQAAMQAQAKYERYVSAKDRLGYEVKAGWLDLYLIDRKIFYTKKRIEVLSMLERQSLSRFEGNETEMINVLYVQMLKDELMSKLELFNDSRRRMQVVFNLRLNRKPDDEIRLTNTLDQWLQGLKVIDSTLSNNSELRAIQCELKASEYGEKSARLSGMPEVGIGLDYVVVERRSDVRLKDNGKDAIMPMFRVRVPIFRRRYRAAVSESKLKQERLLFREQQINNKLRIELEETIERYNKGKRDEELYGRLLLKASQSLEILTVKYETSGKNYEEVMNMQHKIWIYEQRREEAKVMQQKSIAYFEVLNVK